jgi:formimidoylglutamate deiminase
MRLTLLSDLVLGAHGAREDGHVVGVGPATEGERLPGRALDPGFVNAHSHAFQRALRGRVERADPAHPQDDSWTWREQMYSQAEMLDPASVRESSERCYREMLSAGPTSVFEFHYVHHRPGGEPYDDPNALAKAVAQAAQDVGIRVLLLSVAYARGGIPRFRNPSVDVFLERVEKLMTWAKGRPLVQIGLSAHSVRAVPQEWLKAIGGYAHSRRLPLHIHADEQPREIDECEQEHGMRPVQQETVIVHATHANEDELDILAEHGSEVCACPTTEGNLGDGFLPAERLLRRGVRLSIGSDSHVRIDPFEELREIETNAHRLRGRRNVLVPEGGDSPTPYLLRAGWRREEISPGDPADFVDIDLLHPTVSDVEPDDLPSALVFGAGSASVSAAWVAGRRVHPKEERI